MTREQLRQQREDAHFGGPEWAALAAGEPWDGPVPMDPPSRLIDEATAAFLILIGIVLTIFGAGVAAGKWWRR